MPSGLPMVQGMRFRDFVSVNSQKKKHEIDADASPQPADAYVDKDINSGQTLRITSSPKAEFKNHMDINEHMLER